MLWFPQSNNQQFYSSVVGQTTNYSIASGTISSYKNNQAAISINANFSGLGVLGIHGDAGGNNLVATVNGSVAGLTGRGGSWFNSGIMIYNLGTYVLRDLPYQISAGTFNTASTLGVQVRLPTGASVTNFPTVIKLDSTYSNVAYFFKFESSGTGPAVSFGDPATNRSVIKNSGSPNNSATPTFQLGGDNLGENTVLYDAEKTVGTMPFQKIGAGMWVLAGNNSAFTSTSLQGGTLRGTNNNAFGGNITMSAASVALELASNITIANTTAVNAIGTIRNVSGSNTMSGDLTLAGALTLEAQAGTLTLSGLLTGSTALSKTGTGAVSLTNSNNSFSSNPSISSGTFAIASIAASGVASALGTGTGLTLSGSGVLRYTGATGGRFTRTLTAANITGGFENDNNSSFEIAASAGSITGTSTVKLGGTGTGQYNTLGVTVAGGGFTKEGPGRWIATASNNLAGATTVSAGTLMAANADGATKKLLGGNVTVAAGAKIQTGSDNGQKGRNNYVDLTFAGTPGTPAKLRIGGSAVSPTVQMSGNLTISGAVTWDLTADTFKTPGTYTLIEFTGSGTLVGGSGSLANVTLTKPTGRTASNLTYNTPVGGPNTITVQIS